MRNTAEDIIAITQAALDGKPVEVLIGDKAWTLIASLRFDWDKYFYRVRPEPEIMSVPRTGTNWTWLVSSDGWWPTWYSPVVEVFTHEDLDAIHSASLKARGIESPQYREPEVSQDYSAGYLAGYKVGKSDQLEAKGGK